MLRKFNQGKLVQKQNPRRLIVHTDTLLAIAATFLISISASQVSAQSANDGSGRSREASTPLQISPEGVRQLQDAGIAFVLIDAESDIRPAVPTGPSRRIYYTSGPSTRAAQMRVIQDRKAAPASLQNAPPNLTQRLTGTPLEWQQLKLKFDQIPVPTRPLLMTPKQLSEAMKDDVDVQLIDLRPAQQAGDVSPFPGSLRLLPHQVEADTTQFSKKRWMVLVDGGDRVASFIAERLFAKGFLLIAVLDGGYPAWVQATDR